MILRSSNTSAFSLAEVTVALSMAAFTLVAIFGLLPIGLNSTRDSIGQTAANSIVSAVISDLRATRPDAKSTDLFRIAVPIDPTKAPTAAQTLFFDAEGAPNTTIQTDSRYRVDISFLPANHPQAAAQALLQISWPALASPEDAQGTVKVFCAFGRN